MSNRTVRAIKKTRQQLLDEFLEDTGLESFQPPAFVEWARSKGPEHPAYSYFEWDDSKAALQHRLNQARHFAQGLRITIQKSVVREARTIKIDTIEVPALFSRREGRREGEGYTPTTPENLDKLAYERSLDLQDWVRRNEGVMKHCGIDMNEDSLNSTLKKLRSKVESKKE